MSAKNKNPELTLPMVVPEQDSYAPIPEMGQSPTHSSFMTGPSHPTFVPGTSHRSLAQDADYYTPPPVVPTSSSKLVMERKMPAPGTRDAPKFTSEKPEGLRRFIRLMEDLWKEAGVTKDAAKKSMIGKYADLDSEEEWAAFKTFEDGYSWEEFKAELIENYPEAAAAERGTPARIRQLCAETSKVRLGDMPALYAFNRAFMAEARKLQKPPKAMANRELVELFIGCLSESLGSALLQYLGNKVFSTSVKRDDAKEDRRPEDRYDLEEVSKAAIWVSDNSQGIFALMKQESSVKPGGRGVLLFNQPASESRALMEKVDELEGIQALERDRLVSVTKTMESKLTGLEELIKTLVSQSQSSASQGQCKGDCKGGMCKTHETSNPPPAPTQRWAARSMDNEKCFWCGQTGHFQSDCDDLKSQIRSGNVKVNPEGKLRLKDGSFIPNHPAGATMKEKVERHYARKPSQFYYGEYEESDPIPSLTSKYSQYLNTSEDAEKRVARLEAELELRKREDALELRKRKLEQEERKLEQSSGSTRSTNVVDLLGQLTEDEILAIKAARQGFP
jgi:Zinc knuckle